MYVEKTAKKLVSVPSRTNRPMKRDGYISFARLSALNNMCQKFWTFRDRAFTVWAFETFPYKEQYFRSGDIIFGSLASEDVVTWTV